MFETYMHSYFPVDASPKSGRYYKQHTIADLMSIELEPSNTLVHPVWDRAHDDRMKSLENDSWLDARLKTAFTTYSRLAALNAATQPWYKPNFKARFDKIRYWLHIKLIEWKVII